jgi:hypothetical protein
MADMVATMTSEVVVVQDAPATTRIVVVQDPTSITGGTILYDKTVPVGKKFNGGISVSGQLSDSE